MKKSKVLLIACALFLVASSVSAMGKRPHNLNVFGSDDHQKRREYVVHTNLNTPTPVPEPATMFLLGAGLVGLGLYSRKTK